MSLQPKKNDTVLYCIVLYCILNNRRRGREGGILQGIRTILYIIGITNLEAKKKEREKVREGGKYTETTSRVDKKKTEQKKKIGVFEYICVYSLSYS